MPAGTQQTVSLQQAVDRSRTDETSSLGHGHELPAAQGGAAFGAAADQDDGAGGKVHGGKSWRCPNGFSALDLLGVERQSAAAGQQAGPAAGNGPAALPPPPAAIKDAGTAAAPSTAINGFNTPQPPSTQPAAALPPQPPPHLPPLPQLHHTVMQSATGQRVSVHHLPVGPPSFMSSFTTLKRSGSSRQHLSSLPKASHDMDENSAEEAESEDEEELRKVQANVASAGGQKGATGLLAASRPGDGRPDGQPGYYSAASTSGKRSKDAASAAASQHGQGGGQQREEEEAEEEEQTRAAAWRWKFTRRWRAEQTRAPSIDGKADGDETEEALQYLRATGGGTVALQVARTVSADIANSESTGTLDHMSLLASELLSDDASTPKAGGQRSLLSRAGSDLQAASKQVSTIARRAEALKEEQANIEKAAAQQWRVANSSTPPKGSGIKAEWVGSLLPSVEADDWGTFRAVSMPPPVAAPSTAASLAG